MAKANKFVQTFESFTSTLNEKYSSSDIKKLRVFTDEVADDIYDSYEDEFMDGKLDEDEFSREEMFDYISDWGENNEMTVKEIIADFDWKDLRDELGLR